MNANSLKEGLTTKYLGREIIYLEQLDSTNLMAKSLMQESNLEEGTIVIASQQNLGKGTDGNVWVSDIGNLYLSVIFSYSEKVNTLFPLYPAVAIAKVLKEHYHIDAHVKWPNDVLVASKKIAGILCEGDAGRFMVMGIGINVLQTAFKGELQNIATSIQQQRKEDIKLEEVFQKFLLEYEALYYGDCNIRQEWLSITKMIGKEISISQDGKVSKVKVVGMNEDGFLQVQDSKGDISSLMARRGLDISTNYS